MMSEFLSLSGSVSDLRAACVIYACIAVVAFVAIAVIG